MMFYLQTKALTQNVNIMKKQTLTFGLIALMGIFILTGCEKEEEMTPVADMTIAEYALSDDNFSILVQALTKAELVNVLNGDWQLHSVRSDKCRIHHPVFPARN